MFRKIVLLAMVALVLVDLTGCSGRSRTRRRTPVAFEKWTEYKAPDGTFTVFFPTAPKVDSKKSQTTISTTYFSNNKGEAYHVSVSNATDEAVAERRDKDPNVVSRRADLYSKQHKETKAYGETALELTWDKDGYTYRGLVFKTHEGHQLFTLWARWKGSQEPTNAKKFMESFKLGAYTPRPKPTVTATASASPSPAPDDEESATPSGSPSPEEDEKDAKISDDKEGEGE